MTKRERIEAMFPGSDPTMTPHLCRSRGVWQCQSLEFWGCGWTAREAYARWRDYMERRGLRRFNA